MLYLVTGKYVGPTNTLGSRMKITTFFGSKMVPYNHASNFGMTDEDAVKAFIEIAKKCTPGVEVFVKNIQRCAVPGDLAGYVIDCDLR